MFLFWAAYNFLYATALWSHLDVPGAFYVNSVGARLGRPAMDVFHFLLSTGPQFTNIPITPTASAPIPILIETPAPTPTPTPTPTSTRIPIPNTIIFPASPLPTARLRHKALPLCYDGLNDDSASGTGSATRTAAGTPTDLIANGPGLITRYSLVISALASALATHLVHSAACPVVVCILSLVCLSRLLFVTRRTAFKVTTARTRISCHRPYPCGGDSNVREVPNSQDSLVPAATSSPPSSPPPAPFKKFVTMGPALMKTGRLIARKQRNRVRKQTPVKVNGTPSAPRNNRTPPISHPRNYPPPEPVEADLCVWTVEDGSTIEYTPLASDYNFL